MRHESEGGGGLATPILTSAPNNRESVAVTPAHIQVVPGVKVTTSGFNSRADSESKMSYTHGSNSQRFRSYEFLKYSK